MMFGNRTRRPLTKRTSNNAIINRQTLLSSNENYSNISSTSTSDITSEIGTDYIGSEKSDGDSDVGAPLLERILRYRKPNDDLFKFQFENGEDDQSTIGLPFSDDEESSGDVVVNSEFLQPKTTVEIKRILDDENNQFSKEYFETMREIEDYKLMSFSPPCSTCSLCSTCTEDTWDALHIDEDQLPDGPELLDQETFEEFEQLNNEHSDLLSALLSSTTFDENSTTERHDQATDLSPENVEEDEDEQIHQEETIEVETDHESQVEYIEDNFERELENFGDKKSNKRNKYAEKKPAGIAKMLSTYDQEFFISPPDYDYFQNEKLPYSYDLDDDVPWKIRERSSRKCSSWLSKYYSNN